jgi:predicted transposase/invertase (TIGR01784 family)
MSFNKKYKDTIFSSLFSDPDILRELYCALDNVSLPKDVPITINTLEEVLFNDMFNDLSFEIGGKIVVLIEHQSTINPNMALRMLMYVGRVYEKIVKDDSIYKSKQLTIPAPEFFVFYNGEAPYPDKMILKLSDLFENPSDLWMLPALSERQGSIQRDINLELVVRVININEGRNAELAQKCKALAHYSVFVGKMRENRKAGMSLEEVARKAVEYCLKNDILKEFLEKHATEVLGMLMKEWNWDDALAVRFKEGWEGGLEKGREETARNALMKGFSIDVIHDITGLDEETIINLQYQEG